MSTKKVQLKSPENNPDLGLSKDEQYYPITSVDAVKGLQNMAYQPATIDADGLMSKEDKQKLDSVVIEPLSDIKLKSPNGTVFLVTIGDDGKIQTQVKSSSDASE
ncbi:hypothetical protein [Lactiplantibacillus plantarum]|uniref:hypothetical protein n=1 Tax=Lactiplantibacillus TaxID=2767842 RepID=UPI001BAC65B7|nr:hypothetical protein [Lactiplantibacillus plantarum]MBS0955863.1 hypothetical protein [Lactiplantibacillus plantarum]